MRVRKVDRKIGLSRAVAAALSDPRDPERIAYTFLYPLHPPHLYRLVKYPG